MVKRTIYGILGAIFICTALFLNQFFPLILNILVAIACLWSIFELFCAMGISNFFLITIPSMFFSIFIPLFFNYIKIHGTLYTYSLIVFLTILILNQKIDFKSIFVVYTMTMVITLSLSFLISLRNLSNKYAFFYIIICFAISWMTDTGAYFFGSFFGKHKLCPRISPKKTIEGAIGGIVAAILSVVLICFIFNLFLFKGSIKFNIYLMLFMAIIGSIIAMIGDLSFSAVKRGCHVKDFGNVIPGHGGILDRIDSVILVVPFVYFCLTMFPVFIN